MYFGSARTKPDDPLYERGRELGREVALLLDAPTWTGAGPGMMEAPQRGAREVGKPTGGVKIGLPHTKYTEHEQTINPYIILGNVAVCVKFSPRKIGLVDAGTRSSEQERTAYITFPGCFGTLDELFEILTLIQMGKLGSNYPVPVILMNYERYFDKLMAWLKYCTEKGTLSQHELDVINVCNTNRQALDSLADFYNIPQSNRPYLSRVLTE